MKRSDLKLILEAIRLRSADEPSLKRCYDELLDAYNKTGSGQRLDWRIPVMNDLTYIQIDRD